MQNLSDSDTAKLRKTQIRLLDAVDAICARHNLKYWLEGGTLIGAVRHKGFIPWDDDLDLSMPIEDYHKFTMLAEKELPNDIFLQNTKTDPTFREAFTKLRDCYSTFVEHHETEEYVKTHPYHKGIFIDIFPSVLYPKMPRLFRRIMMHATVITRSNAKVAKRNVYFNYPAYYFLKFIWFFIFLFKKSSYGQTPEDNGYMYTIPLSCLYPLKKIEFEGKMYPAPNDPHAHLSRMFKNHMTPPPLEKRVPHASAIYPDIPCDHPRALKHQ